MKSILFLILISTSTLIGQTNKKDSLVVQPESRLDCLQRMKTGKFEYRSQGSLVEIKRTKKKQIEKVGDYKIKTYVSWQNDSTFHLKSYQMDISGCLKIGDEIKISITSCKNNKYTAFFTSENCGQGTSEFIKVD